MENRSIDSPGLPVPVTGDRVRLLCTVRGCRQPLITEERRLVCPSGHAFDQARSGYWNLLQPQDRRSRQPGDATPVVEARRRLYDAGFGSPLIGELRRQLESVAALAAPALLDVGCGEGSILGAVAASSDLEAYGVDISAFAVDLAARRFPRPGWVVANADRFLPFEDGSFDAALSVTARLEPAELERVLTPGGLLVVVVPAPDDLLELRSAVLGEELQKERLSRVVDVLWRFEPVARRQVRHAVDLDRGGLHDALVATYRGGRRSRLARLAELPPMRVTMSFDLACFRRPG